MNTNQNLATIWVRTSNRTYLPADRWQELGQALALDEPWMINFLVSRIIFSRDGGDSIIIEDRMEPMIQDLCLHGVKALLSDEDYIFNHWDYEGTISLIDEGNGVRICGRGFQPASFPKQTSIASLLDCAATVMALMKKLQANYSEYNVSAYPYLEELFAECSRLYEVKYGQKLESA
jgi:hypothetical protein